MACNGRFAVAAVNEADDIGARDDFNNGTHVTPRTKVTAAYLCWRTRTAIGQRKSIKSVAK